MKGAGAGGCGRDTGTGIYESTSIGEEDLQQVQDHPSARRGAGDLREHEAQAAPRLADCEQKLARPDYAGETACATILSRHDLVGQAFSLPDFCDRVRYIVLLARTETR